jgi:hypothetical protein
MVAIFEVLGIRFYDHIIVGDGEFYTFREKENLNAMKILPRMSDYDPINLINLSDEIDEMENEY